MDAEDRLIVALDFPSTEPALALLSQIEGRCRWVKVGLELFLATGNAFVEVLRRRGFEVFLDLKLHDIPNTVAGAIRSVGSAGTSLLTVHASGGSAMMEAAVRQAAALESAPKLLAVTVLTSMDESSLHEVGVAAGPREQVLRLGELAVRAGVPGLVCSAEEVRALRQHLGSEVLLVVPGIRSAGAVLGDQRRVATAGDAIAGGANMLVVGRPITQAADPRSAVEALLREITEADRSLK